ncbi:MAG: RNA polymerase sporulation sigma factor SigE [Oscillospiraceae bacterium]|nr:RNA polymerase sporulation sigma factor SigE [Oscillospiraceae bacterium]
MHPSTSISIYRKLKLDLALWARELLDRLGIRPLDDVFYIGGSDTLPPPLTKEEEAYLIGGYAEGKESVKRLLIEHNLRLVVYIARRFENTGINIEDLISIGTIGLIKAINTYKPDKQIKLATYASRCIENEILMHLRKNVNIRNEVSLDEPLNTDWDGNELLLSDILGTEADTVLRPLEDDVDLQLLKSAINLLNEREREIISMRFGLNGHEEHTQKDVADVMGISQSYISRLEKKIITRLRRDITRMM